MIRPLPPVIPAKTNVYENLITEKDLETLKIPQYIKDAMELEERKANEEKKDAKALKRRSLGICLNKRKNKEK